MSHRHCSPIRLLLLSASPGHPGASGVGWIVLLVSTLGPVGVLVVLARGPQGPRRATLLAAGAGITYGLTAALTKSTSHLLHAGVIGLLGHWEVYALVVCGVLGMLLATSAFQAGPLAASLPVLTVVDPVVSIAIGAGAFGEGVATAGVAPVLELVGLVVIAVGVFVLARSPLVTGVVAEP